jgi:hypothetical protein
MTFALNFKLNFYSIVIYIGQFDVLLGLHGNADIFAPIRRQCADV